MVCERRNAQKGCGFGFGSGFGTFSESSLRSFLAMDYPRGNGWGYFDNYGGGGGYGNGGGGGYGRVTVQYPYPSLSQFPPSIR